MALTKLNNQSLSAVTAAGIPTLASANMPTGSVLQVVNTIHAAEQTITGTTQTEYTGITTSITPKVTGSKIYIMVNIMCGNQYNGGDWYSSRLYRDSTSNLVGGVCNFYFNTRYENIGPRLLHNQIDPTTTTAGTARTYKVYLNSEATAAGNLSINWSNNNSQSSMTLMEIAV